MYRLKDNFEVVYTVQRNIFVGSNFCDTEPFLEYLTHENLLSWVEFEQYQSKNEILTHKNQI